MERVQVKTSNNRIRDAAYDRANDAWLRGDLNRAFREFKDAALHKDRRAYFYLAQFYDEGLGTRRSAKQTLYWYRRAYKEGGFDRAGAANNMACIYRKLGEIDRALWWFRRAIEMGERDANFEIAKIRATQGRTGLALVHLRRALRSKDLYGERRCAAEDLLRDLIEKTDPGRGHTRARSKR